jgi:hypothetical protein
MFPNGGYKSLDRLEPLTVLSKTIRDNFHTRQAFTGPRAASMASQLIHCDHQLHYLKRPPWHFTENKRYPHTDLPPLLTRQNHEIFTLLRVAAV